MQNSQQNLPLYPEEAYNTQEQKSEEQKPSQNLFDNPLVPLLLASLQQDGNQNGEMLSKMLGTMSGNSSLIEMLTNSLNMKKNKKEVPKETSSKPFPQNEYL